MNAKQMVACGECGNVKLADKRFEKGERGMRVVVYEGDCPACGESLDKATAVNSWGRNA